MSRSESLGIYTEREWRTISLFGRRDAARARWSKRAFAYRPFAPLLCGLLCHLLIALSLFFPYIDYYNPYGDALQPTLITGWQLLSEPFQPGLMRIVSLMPPLSVPLATVSLATLILPALTYLVCLLRWSVRNKLKDLLLGKGIYVSYLLNTIGWSLSSFFVAFSILCSTGGDLHDPFQDTYRKFLLSLPLPSCFPSLAAICWSITSGFAHSKYNPIEHFWAFWNNTGIGPCSNSVDAVIQYTHTMSRKGYRSQRPDSSFYLRRLFHVVLRYELSGSPCHVRCSVTVSPSEKPACSRVSWSSVWHRIG